MRYLVVSDTHGRIFPVLDRMSGSKWGFDAVIGAGDFYRDGVALSGAQGNNDLEPDSPWSNTWQDGLVRGLVIHGHQWPSHRRRQGLIEKAQALSCNLVIYGHSHVREWIKVGDITLINPGAVHAPRNNQPKTIAVLDIFPDGTLSLKWITLGEEVPL